MEFFSALALRSSSALAFSVRNDREESMVLFAGLIVIATQCVQAMNNWHINLQNHHQTKFMMSDMLVDM